MTILAHPPPEECHAFEKHSLLQEQCCVKQDREGEERKLARPRIHCNFVFVKSNKQKRTLGSGGGGNTAVAETGCSVGVASCIFLFRNGREAG